MSIDGFHYQFNVELIKSGVYWSKNFQCVTWCPGVNDLSRLVGLIVSSYTDLSDLERHITALMNGLGNTPDGYTIQDDVYGALLIKGAQTHILDLFNDNDGVNGVAGPVNYNITTPIEDQFIPTEMILAILKEWHDFLTEQKAMCYVPKAWVREELKVKISI
jgi:hypothetical protein